MTRSGASAILLAAASLAAALPTGAQLATDKPIVVKSPKSGSKPKLVKFKGEVLRCDYVSITVRSRENERLLRTFTYSPGLRGKMHKILDKGGYQYGDKVEIESEPGSDVALRVKGKPSKPL